MDRAWWNRYGGQVQAAIECWCVSREAARVYGLNFIPAEAGGGISRKPGTVRHGGNSGFVAVSLALHFGAARVVLLGYDMQADGRRLHWHADHVGMSNPMAERMRDWVRRFGDLAREVEVPIVNASRQTALRCFPRVALHEGLAEPPALGSRAS